MKTPRHEQPWYESRLINNKKPSPITEEERTVLTDENRRLIEESAKVLEWGVKHGFIKYPRRSELPKCIQPPPNQQPGSSTEPTPLSSLNSSETLNSVWPSSEVL